MQEMFRMKRGANYKYNREHNMKSKQALQKHVNYAI